MEGQTDPRLNSHLIRIAQMIASESSATAPPDAEETPEYVLQSRLGDGGEGVVYLATQTALQRRVALKSPHPEHETTFRLRARAWGLLDHPNIVPVYDLAHGVVGERIAPVLAMKHVEGRPWSKVIASGDAAGTHDHLEILLKVADALAYTHSRGIAHCDVKPSNVVVGKFGEVVLVDWGMMRICDPREAELQEIASELPHVGGGTEAYMAPEQRSGADGQVGVRSDVFALGVILREVAAAGSGDAQAVPGLEAVAARATRGDPAERHADAGEFAEDLRAHLRGHHSRRKGDQLASRAAELLDSVPPAGSPERLAGLRECDRLLDESLRSWGDNPSALKLRGDVRVMLAETFLAEGALHVARAEADRIEDSQARARVIQGVASERAKARRKTLYLRTSVATTVAAGMLLTTVWVGSIIRAERSAADQARLQAKLDIEASKARDQSAQREVMERLAALQEKETRFAERARDAIPAPTAIQGTADRSSEAGSIGDLLPELESLQRERNAIASRYPAPLPAPHRTLLTARADAALAFEDRPESMDEAIASYEALAAQRPWDADLLSRLAVALARAGRLREADAAAKRSLEVADKSPVPDGELRARALSIAAQIQHELGNDDAARDFDERSLDILRRTWEGKTLDFTRELLRVGHAGDALQVVNAWDAVVGQDSNESAKSPQFERGMELLAEAQMIIGRQADAVATIDQLIELRGMATDGTPPHPRLPIWEGLKAQALTRLRAFDQAEPLFLSVMARLERASPSMRGDYLTVLSDYAIMLRQAGRLEESEARQREYIKLATEFRGEDHAHVANAKRNLAELLGALGRHDEAEALMLEAIEDIRRAEGPDSSRLGGAWITLSSIRIRAGRNAEGLEAVREAVCMFQRRGAPQSESGPNYWQNAVAAAMRMGMWEQATAYAFESFEQSTSLLGPHSPAARRAASTLLGRFRSSRAPQWSKPRENAILTGVWLHRSLFEGPDVRLDAGQEALYQVRGMRSLLENQPEPSGLSTADSVALMKRAVALSGIAGSGEPGSGLDEFYAACTARLVALGEVVPSPIEKNPADGATSYTTSSLARALDSIATFPVIPEAIDPPTQTPEGARLVAEFLQGCSRETSDAAPYSGEN